MRQFFYITLLALNCLAVQAATFPNVFTTNAVGANGVLNTAVGTMAYTNGPTFMTENTNVIYNLAKQWIPRPGMEVVQDLSSTWNTNPINSGAAEIPSNDTNHHFYVTTVTPGSYTNFYVNNGRLTADLLATKTAAYFGWANSNTPTVIGTRVRVTGRGALSGCDFIQLVIGTSTNEMVTAPGNQSINVHQWIHFVCNVDNANFSLSFFTNGAGIPASQTNLSIGQPSSLYNPAANYASSPIGNRTTIGANTPDLGEVFDIEMIHTPAMGNNIKLRVRNQSVIISDPLVSQFWGRFCLLEFFPLNVGAQFYSTFEVLEVWSGVRPEDLQSGAVDMTVGNITVASNLTVSGNSTFNNTTSGVLNVSSSATNWNMSGFSNTNPATGNRTMVAPTNTATAGWYLGASDSSGTTAWLNTNTLGGAGTTYPSPVHTNGFSLFAVFSNTVAIDKLHSLVSTNLIQAGSPATADNGAYWLYGTNGHLSRLSGVNAEGVDQAGFSWQLDSTIAAYFGTNHFKFLKTIVITNTDNSFVTSPTNLFEARGTNGGLVAIGNDGSVTIKAPVGPSGSDSVFWFTNGLTTLRSNLLAPTSITAPATTVNWTNPIDSTIEVYIDNSGVTGTAIKKNNTTIFTSLVGDVTIGLQSGEYISLTYTIGTPSIKWSPR